MRRSGNSALSVHWHVAGWKSLRNERGQQQTIASPLCASANVFGRCDRLLEHVARPTRQVHGQKKKKKRVASSRQRCTVDDASLKNVGKGSKVSCARPYACNTCTVTPNPAEAILPSLFVEKEWKKHENKKRTRKSQVSWKRKKTHSRNGKIISTSYYCSLNYVHHRTHASMRPRCERNAAASVP